MMLPRFSRLSFRKALALMWVTEAVLLIFMASTADAGWFSRRARQQCQGGSCGAPQGYARPQPQVQQVPVQYQRPAYAAPQASPQAGQATGGDPWGVIAQANAYRAQVGVGPLRLGGADLQASAQNSANNGFRHSYGGPWLGQVVAMGNPSSAVAMWIGARDAHTGYVLNGGFTEAAVGVSGNVTVMELR